MPAPGNINGINKCNSCKFASVHYSEGSGCPRCLDGIMGNVDLKTANGSVVAGETAAHICSWADTGTSFDFCKTNNCPMKRCNRTGDILDDSAKYSGSSKGTNDYA